jgi:hypothetical protein
VLRIAGDLLVEHADLLLESSLTYGVREDSRQRVHVGRLGLEVEGADAQRGHCGVQIGVRGEEDDGEVRPGGDDSLAQLEPVHPTHLEVGDDGVHVTRAERFEDALGVGLERRLEAASRELGSEQITHALIVVDDEDARVNRSR